jgi:16S rRNA (cytosine967-C5)-methyltransferase
MNPRKEAVRLLDRTFEDDGYANRLLDASLSRFDGNPQDKGLLTELFYGVLRHLYLVDEILDRQASRGVRSIDDKILNILRIAVYQLVFLDRIPPHAAVSEAVKHVRKARGQRVAGFVNGLLRSLVRSQERGTFSLPEGDDSETLSLLTSHPLWLTERLVDRLGPELARERLEAHNQPPLLTLRAHRGWGSREKLMQLLEKEGFSVEATTFAADGLHVLSQGGRVLQFLTRHHPSSFVVQDEAAQLMAEWLAPKDGEVVLDSCAAPGSKTTHIAGLAPGASVIGQDIYKHKLKLIDKSCRRLGLHNITSRLLDAREESGEQFDRILCDAPCSGLGTLRRHPEIRYRREPEDLPHFARLQTEMLHSLAKQLKPGGVLLYSVCTDTVEENEKVVEKFLETHPDWTLDRSIPEHWTPLLSDEGWLRTSPGENEMDAFFAARLIKPA